VSPHSQSQKSAGILPAINTTKESPLRLYASYFLRSAGILPATRNRLTPSTQCFTIPPAMKKRTIDNLPILEFSSFPNNGTLHHAVFTRQGGLSQGHFHSLNMSLSVPDDEGTVLVNRAIGYGRYQRTNDTLVHALRQFCNLISNLFTNPAEANRFGAGGIMQCDNLIASDRVRAFCTTDNRKPTTSIHPRLHKPAHALNIKRNFRH
jgi:hypothetical protein